MSHQQKQRRIKTTSQLEPITYGDVFNVQGDLAEKPVTPKDASMMQRAETALLGRTQRGGAASLMQSAASWNARSGLFYGGSYDGSISGIDSDSSDNDSYSDEVENGGGSRDVITIGEALEAAALTAGQKPVERSDAAAIQAAEVRATGRTTIIPGGVAATAQSAAIRNARMNSDADKAKLADILTDAASKFPSDKEVTRRDAEGVAGAEMRNDPDLTTYPAGISASITAAARLNEKN
ncbi:hypothetical protein SAY87_004626 [Trapa incisa]|uniref:SMP domain-containing protein n=1 Tax=Trapa incisa TaxID=236973 RepID=A0AAN7PMR6_9MYRT|nr:hypothetical protein SAY87_004626 [Trapa incisa]